MALRYDLDSYGRARWRRESLRMDRSDPTLYLPVTRDAASAFVDAGTLPELPVERAALYALLLVLGTDTPSRRKAHAALVDAERLFAQLGAAPAGEFLRDRRAELGTLLPDDVAAQLEAAGVLFATPEAMASRLWCGADGRYTAAFQDLCHDTLMEFDLCTSDVLTSEGEGGAAGKSDAEDVEEEEDGEGSATGIGRAPRRLRSTSDQARMATAVAANPDEHFDLSAYAGSGKTHLMLELSETLGRCAHLAPTAAHRYAFQQRGGLRGIRSYTQAELAMKMLSGEMRARSIRWTNPPKIGTSQVPLQRQAELAGVPPIGAANAVTVLLRIFDALKNWCLSDRYLLGTADLPWGISAGEKPAYIAHTQRVWELMFNPKAMGCSSPFSTRLYHVVKWLALAGAQIPDVGVLLVDEAHDLSPSWMKLLDAYVNGWILMGDPYQRLDGRLGRLERVKSMAMAQSVRTGEQAMPMIGTVLSLHSESLMPLDIQGSRDHITRRREYTSADDAPANGLRVYGSEWQMLADALRLKDAGARFRFVPRSGELLLKASQDAINLFRYGDRPREFHLSRFQTWDALAAHLDAIGQGKVARLVERGYTSDHAAALLRAGAPVAGQEADDILTLGLLEHCKNLEAGAVVMSPCCFAQATNISRERDRAVRAVYLAMTRVRDELWYPGGALETLTEAISRPRQQEMAES